MIPTMVSQNSKIGAAGFDYHHEWHVCGEEEQQQQQQQQQHEQQQQEQKQWHQLRRLYNPRHSHELFPISPSSCDATTTIVTTAATKKETATEVSDKEIAVAVDASNTKKRQRSFTNPMKEQQPQHGSNGDDARKTAITECMSNLSIVDGNGIVSGDGNHEHTVASSNIATAVTNHDMTPAAISATRNVTTTTSWDAHPPRRQEQRRRQSYGDGGRSNVTNLHMLQHRQLNSPAARLGLQMLMYKHPNNSRRDRSNNRSSSSGSGSGGTHPSSPAPSSKSRFMNIIIEDNYYPSFDEEINACESSEKRQRVKSVLSSSSW